LIDEKKEEKMVLLKVFCWYIGIVVSLAIVFAIICFIQFIENKILKKRFPDDESFIKYMRQLPDFTILLDYAKSKGIIVKMDRKKGSNLDVKNRIIMINPRVVINKKSRLIGIALFAYQIGYIELYDDPRTANCKKEVLERNFGMHLGCCEVERDAWEMGSIIINALKLLVPEYWKYYEKFQVYRYSCEDCSLSQKCNTDVSRTAAESY